MDKRQLVQEIIERLEHDQRLLLQAARSAHRAATDPENIPDNKYETLALESSYLAQGQANRAQDILLALERYRTLVVRQFNDSDPIYLTALVGIAAEEGNPRLLFLGPAAGGLRVRLDAAEVVVITPGSPLGRDLLGKEVGDVVEIEVDGRPIDYEVVSLC